jgi:hypothetical protein
MLPKFYGTIENGKLELINPTEYQTYLNTLSGEIELTVKKRTKKRTLSQNAYYWGVVVKMIAEETGHDSDEIHELMKQMFLKDLIKIKGEIYETVKSTTELETKGFSLDYIERIKYWAMEKLNLNIPSPDEVYK